MTVRKSVSNRLSALTVVGGTLLLGTTLWTSSHSQSIDKPDTPLKVALVLDCITQPRFQEDLPIFGMGRMMPVAGGHLVAGQLSLPTQKDRDLFKTAEGAHRDFLIGFVHCAHVPGSRAGAGFGGTRGVMVRTGGSFGKAKAGAPSDPPSPESALYVSPVCNRLRHLYADQPKTAATEQANLYQEMSNTAQKDLPTLMKGKGAEQEVGDWLVVARPVRALKTTCLKCHVGAKMGDTLGVLTYAVSKKTFAAVLPTPRVGPDAVGAPEAPGGKAGGFGTPGKGGF